MNSFPSQCSHPLVYIFEMYIYFYWVECLSEISPMFICISVGFPGTMGPSSGSASSAYATGLETSSTGSFVSLFGSSESSNLMSYDSVTTLTPAVHSTSSVAPLGAAPPAAAPPLSASANKSKGIHLVHLAVLRGVVHFRALLLRIEAISSIHLEGSGQELGRRNTYTIMPLRFWASTWHHQHWTPRTGGASTTLRLSTGLEPIQSSGSFSSVSTQASLPSKPSSSKQQQQQSTSSSKLSSPAKGGGGGFPLSLRSTLTSAPAIQTALLHPAGLQSLHSQAARAPHSLSPECGSALIRPSSTSLSVSVTSSSRQLPPAPCQTSATHSSRQHKPRPDWYTSCEWENTEFILSVRRFEEKVVVVFFSRLPSLSYSSHFYFSCSLDTQFDFSGVDNGLV